MTRASTGFTTWVRRIVAVVAALCLLASCTSDIPGGGPEEEPLQTKPEAEIAELARTRAQEIADTVGHPLENWRTNTSPCLGRRGETAEDGRWTLSGFAGLPVPPDEQLATLARVREMWQQRGYEITEDRVFPSGAGGAVSTRDPSTGITISLSTTKDYERVALILAAGCYMPVDGEDPANQ